MENEAQVADTAQETTSWYSDDHREIVERTGWKSPDDAIKSYRELEKDYSGKVKIPGEDATPEEISSFYQKLPGIPESADKYSLPEIGEDEAFDESFLNPMRVAAFEANVPDKAFNALASKYMAIQKEAHERRESELNAQEESLVQEWGVKADENFEVARRATQEFIGEDDGLKEFIKSEGLDTHPVFKKLMYQIGTKMLDDKLIKGEQVKNEDDYAPKYPNSPDMYRYGDDEESQKGRAWHTARGYKY